MKRKKKYAVQWINQLKRYYQLITDKQSLITEFKQQQQYINELEEQLKIKHQMDSRVLRFLQHKNEWDSDAVEHINHITDVFVRYIVAHPTMPEAFHLAERSRELVNQWMALLLDQRIIEDSFYLYSNETIQHLDKQRMIDIANQCLQS